MIENSWWLAGGLLGALLAAAAWVLCAQPWRPPSAGRAALAYTVAVFAGFFGATLAHLLSKRVTPWPPQESAHYLLMVVAPAALLVQIISSIGPPRLPRWLGWVLRAALILATPPLLIWKSLRGNDWPAAQAAALCLGLSAGIAVVWVLLSWLGRQNPGRGPWLSMWVTTVAGGAVLLASGSLTIGQMGLTLAAAVFGALLASLLGRAPAALEGGLGIAWIIFAGLLIQGRFLAELGNVPAVVLGLAPLTGLAARIPPLRARPWAAALACIVAAAVVTGAVAVPTLIQAKQASEAAGAEGY